MSDPFRDQAKALNALRTQKEAARAALSLARDRVARGADGASEAEARAAKAYQAIVDREGRLLGQLGELSDPRGAVAGLSDADPLLLLPVRIETRFKTLVGDAQARSHELWLRIYPDDCVIDSFEPFPSDAEIKATQIYWRNIWRAGGDESGEKAAWKGLVGSCGAGRAAWLVRTYQPVNLADKPARSTPPDVLLIGASDTAPDVPTLTALTTYWPAIWQANGNKAAIDAARAALVGALGGDAAADAAIGAYAPFNLNDAPIAPGTRTAPTPRFLIVLFPDSATIESQRLSWGSSPKAHILPDRFVATGYAAAYAPGAEPAFVAMGAPVPSPLVLGIDPNAPKGEQLDPTGDDIDFGEDLAWMVEFDAAVKKGMGLRIPITAAQARTGFDRIIVTGVRATADAAEGQAALATLIAHHRDGRNGFALLPQGTATNNVEDKPADFRLSQDADQGYAAAFTEAGTPLPEADWSAQRDGARLAAALGLPIEAMGGIVGVNGADQIEARTMHLALFPGTLGYFLHDMIGDAISDDAFDFLRGYFIDTVSGRGPIPAIRIGAQPYGILPTTAFSRLSFARQSDGPLTNVRLTSPNYLDRLAAVLRIAERDWAGMVPNAAWVGRSGDPHRTLLDILGEYPASIEFYRRTAESLEEHINKLNLAGGGLPADLVTALEAIFRKTEIPALLQRLGIPVPVNPPISDRIFSDRHYLLGGPVVDDVPLSEADLVRAYTADDRNYLDWLADAALADMDLLRRQSGFVDNAPPLALLYIIQRFALLSGYRHEGINRLLEVAAIDDVAARSFRRDPPFVHVKDGAASESRFSQLYAAAPAAIVGATPMALHQKIAADLRARIASPALRQQIDAVRALADLPTARLERLFVEHVDCLSYRVDAWRTGLATTRLRQMRNTGQAQEPSGILIGAYGWVENIRPRAPFEAFDVPADLAEIFADPKAGAVAIDPANQGFIHAPSLDHAVTAAVLRSGHMSVADPADGAELAVNLSSERVRRAVAAMQGMREGQSLAALLGYQFERGLHERHAPLELDRFIQPLRNLFPLDANRIPDTAVPADAEETISARNVIDGRKFATALLALSDAARRYPFGLSNVPGATNDETAAIGVEADRLLDTLDAVSDVAIAESVHQAARGNFERAAGMLDAFSRGSPPPEPEVAMTPRSGTTLTHRVALHLDPDTPAGGGTTPRALAEPRIDAWLGTLLPPLSSIACSVTWFDFVLGAPAAPVRVSVADLGLAPIDLVDLLPDDGQQALAALDELVLAYVQTANAVPPDATVTIEHVTPVDAASVTLFEVASLIGSLRALLAKARPLAASDLAPPSAPYPDAAPVIDITPAHITDRVAPLVAIRDACAALASEAAATAKADRDGAAGARDALIAAIDEYGSRLTDAAAQAALYGVQPAGRVLVQEGRRAAFAAIRAVATATVTRWQGRLTIAEARLADEAALPTTASDDERRTLLRAAETQVSASLAFTDTVPTADDLRAAVAAKRGAFATRLAMFAALAKANGTAIKAFIDDARATLPVADFEQIGPSFDDAEAGLVRFCEDIAKSAASLTSDVTRRLDATQTALADLGLAAGDAARATALDTAAKALFGEAFLLVPGLRFGTAVPIDGTGNSQAADWAAAIGGAGPAGLLGYLIDDLGRIDPVDEWLAGAARVRPLLKHLERVAILAEGFGADHVGLDAFQLPYAAGDAWLGAEFPPTQDISRDRLLYTAALPGAWDSTRPVFGLLIDEWVETLPNNAERTGLAFHYDRPNSEPPQTMLLVVPSVITGAWRWDDIMDALNETLDLAKQRAVEPSQLDASAYARLLPTILFATAQSEITLVADLAINNIADFRLQEIDR
jgi:hypothetical protein